jgi:putative tryptophan/tyrosine transport system substrate-binding protein
MRRRDFIVFLSGATAWPLAARAEQPTPTARRLGVLMQPSAQAAKARGFLDAFIKALQEAGWVEGQNVIFERRFADGKEELLANLAAALVQLRLDAIVTDSTPSARAVKNATQTIPIVMAASGDAVTNGLVASFSRPGGNVTGMSILTGDLTGRRLQLLTEMVPGLKRVAILMNPSDLGQVSQLKEAQTAAQSLSVELTSQRLPRRTNSTARLLPSVSRMLKRCLCCRARCSSINIHASLRLRWRPACRRCLRRGRSPRLED